MDSYPKKVINVSSSILFKTLLMGESESLNDAFFDMLSPISFSTSYKNTIGVDFGVGVLPVQSELEYMVKLQLWVLNNGSRFANFIPPFLKGASGCVIIIDVNQRQQLERAYNYWLPLIEENAHSAIKLVVGCVDPHSNRQFQADKAHRLVHHHSAHYREVRTSVQDDVIRVFQYLADLMIETVLQEYNPSRNLEPIKQVIETLGYYIEIDMVPLIKPRYTFHVNLRTGGVFISPTACSCEEKCQYSTRLCIIPTGQFKGWSNLPELSKQDIGIIAKLLTLDNDMVPNEVVSQIRSAEKKWRKCQKV
ncbi:MAG: hypothetical protein ACE5I5_14355 [Candidatus Heimdallarchaeota archaeon]